MRISRTVFLSLMVLVLAGCSAPAKKAAPAPKANRVGVISLLPSELSYQKFGVTKFNNEVTSRPVGDVFNVAARAGAQSALRMSGRSVIQLDVDVPTMTRHVQSYPGSLEVKVEQIEEEVQALVKEHKLDAVVLMVETIEKDKPIKGIRVVVRAGIGYIDKAEIMPHFAMVALDKNGKRLSMVSVTSAYPANRAADAPWVYTLADNLDAPTHDQFTKFLQTAIESEAEQGVMSLSF